MGESLLSPLFGNPTPFRVSGGGQKLHNKMGLSFGDIAKKIGKSRKRIFNIYKIIDLILKCLAGETLIFYVIQKPNYLIKIPKSVSELF